jgi:type IV secretory pathway VirD2 relaxase
MDQKKQEQQLADELNRRHKEIAAGTAEPVSWKVLKRQLKRESPDRTKLSGRK